MREKAPSKSCHFGKENFGLRPIAAQRGEVYLLSLFPEWNRLDPKLLFGKPGIVFLVTGGRSLGLVFFTSLDTPGVKFISNFNGIVSSTVAGLTSNF